MNKESLTVGEDGLKTADSPGSENPRTPQAKVCGLTRVDEAIACAELGINAIGLVFYPPSPRFISDLQAREISTALPERIWRIGVFVNEPYSTILKKAEFCRLTAVQLHGAESPEMVAALEQAGVRVIKSLFLKKEPQVSTASRYGATAYLLESGQGRLPGGNAISWDWGAVKGSLGDLPCILAGGLNPENVADAVREFGPDAVDVSSGVESEPGRKEIMKVKAFLEELHKAESSRVPKKIFR
ncbi:MAG: phosphoribosylanthranilate isomerase [Syntrophobacteraceae bacterium]